MHNLCIYLDLKIGLVVMLEIVLFFNIDFCQSIGALQCCVIFYCIAK